jgi:hypothetical protein
MKFINHNMMIKAIRLIQIIDPTLLKGNHLCNNRMLLVWLEVKVPKKLQLEWEEVTEPAAQKVSLEQMVAICCIQI